jgi:hypothetical protein
MAMRCFNKRSNAVNGRSHGDVRVDAVRAGGFAVHMWAWTGKSVTADPTLSRLGYRAAGLEKRVTCARWRSQKTRFTAEHAERAQHVLGVSRRSLRPLR